MDGCAAYGAEFAFAAFACLGDRNDRSISAVLTDL